jgi:hypothetical protein
MDAATKRFIVGAYSRSRMSLRQLAAFSGWSASQVRRVLVEAGVERRHRIMAKPTKVLVTVDAGDLKALKRIVGKRNVSAFVREAIAVRLRKP